MALADPGKALVRGTHLWQKQLPGRERDEGEGPDENEWERSEGDFTWRELHLLWSRGRFVPRPLPSDPGMLELHLLFVTATCPARPQQGNNTCSF